MNMIPSMKLGSEAPPYDNIDLLRKDKGAEWIHDADFTYERLVKAIGAPIVWNININGSAIEPPLVLAPQKVVAPIINWKTPPSWINATNCIPESCKYLAALLRQYTGRFNIIEGFNEPWYGPTDKLPWCKSDDDLVAFLVAMQRQINITVKTIDPSIKTAGPSFVTPFNVALNQKLVDAGYFDLVDYACLHYYPTLSPLVTPLLRTELPNFAKQVNKPIIVTECGIPNTFTDSDVWEIVTQFSKSGCEILCMTGLYYSIDPKADQKTQAQQLACWKADGTPTQTLNALRDALRSVNYREQKEP